VIEDETLLGEVDQRKVCTTVLSIEVLQQRLGLLEVGGVKAFREPIVDWCQKVIGFLAFALLLPEASQASSGAKFE
jgi:hypothetical protein